MNILENFSFRLNLNNIHNKVSQNVMENHRSIYKMKNFIKNFFTWNMLTGNELEWWLFFLYSFSLADLILFPCITILSISCVLNDSQWWSLARLSCNSRYFLNSRVSFWIFPLLLMIKTWVPGIFSMQFWLCSKIISWDFSSSKNSCWTSRGTSSNEGSGQSSSSDSSIGPG